MELIQKQFSEAIQEAQTTLSGGTMFYSPQITDQVNLASMIDHTLLSPTATEEDIIKLCDEAKQYHFYSVCVNSYYVRLVASNLKGTDVKIASVAGFPLGAMSTSAKAYEARDAVEAGAHEIDMVLNIGALKSGHYKVVLNDIYEVVQASAPAIVKVILETCLLNDEEKITACVLSKMAGAHFVKTSTGFGGGGATYRDVQLMRKVVGEDMGVKASGGIRTISDALCMVTAGANRIGASKSIAIVTAQVPKDFQIPLSCKI